ncbi:MAG: acyl-phosphate glycerol 3-phosphate acyltransferase [Rhodospirillaceae bacterium]|nr:acyl-phosphate glycerol 3-phosphate acyltransferase [Rhodospirillaceae bacterium]
MDPNINLLAFLVIIGALSYLLGSIPFGLLITRMGGRGDIREIGSGNIGATNVLRTGSKLLALLTVLCDGGKGIVAILLATRLGDSAVMVAAIAVIIGHIFPIWLGFKGGKAVATAGGVYFALAWPIGIGAALTWLVVAFATRYSSLAALIATVIAPIFAYFWASNFVIPTVIIAFLIIYRHKENIERLIARTETKIGN